MIYDICAVGVT